MLVNPEASFPLSAMFLIPRLFSDNEGHEICGADYREDFKIISQATDPFKDAGRSLLQHTRMEFNPESFLCWSR